MVLMSAGKSARHAAAICNRNNTEGGDKKPGLSPRVGWFISSNTMLVRAPQTVPRIMHHFHIVPTQRTGYRATLGPH